MSDQVFSGIRVLGLTRVYAAPFAAYQLALHGAEVINVEDPGTGDNVRNMGGAHGKALVDRRMSAPFLAHAAGKKSITLNLKSKEGVAIFRRLAAESDVLIENLRTGGMDALGLGYQDISAINPAIVYCSLTGYGQTGPRAREAVIDPVIQAGSGLMSITGTPESGPLKAGCSISDYTAGMSLTVGIITALYHRQRTGVGQHVDVSMLETTLSMMSANVSDVMNAGHWPGLIGNRSGNNSQISDVFPCGDGRSIFIAANMASLRDKLWDALERPQWKTDPMFRDVDALRANVEPVFEAIATITRTRPVDEWVRIFGEAGVPAMKINTIAEAVDDPQIRAREYFHTFESVPGLDRPVKVQKAPYRLSKTPARLDTPPPLLGAHNAEVLGRLGYGADDLERLKRDGVI